MKWRREYLRLHMRGGNPYARSVLAAHVRARGAWWL